MSSIHASWSGPTESKFDPDKASSVKEAGESL